MYRSLDGCCICRAKSSSSRFTDASGMRRSSGAVFGLVKPDLEKSVMPGTPGEEMEESFLWGPRRIGIMWLMPEEVQALKVTSRAKKIKSISKKARPIQISRLQKEFKRNNSDSHSTTSSASPAHSPSYSNLSDDGSDAELSPGSSRSPVFLLSGYTYWKRQRVCCGIIYKGRFGEVLIDPHLFKPCCRKKQRQQGPDEEEDEEEDDEEEEEVEESQAGAEVGVQKSHVEEEVKETQLSDENTQAAQLRVSVTTPAPKRSGLAEDEPW
ncbi:SIN3-HDAC complex-associated factor-like [Thalassophryne amazonica]|uniref:SIN3-HDAC complex-associated factor-like n=1 Tax=Thalassophryne amazonica TaxID=390379 RepID=UPI001470F7B8|nr:SIN3-HDAC complex-associated factor-like [Thalassophryne amazonica]XP_034032618.1 SIN3-HDAC complex-associated factor-like [Thalassophryne amazonica]